MRVLNSLHALWAELSTQARIKLFVGVVGLLIGLPTSAIGLVWLETRQAVQLSNCSDDFAQPLLNALMQNDEKLIEQAASLDRGEQSKRCAVGALQRPTGTASFLLDEHRRLADVSH